MPTTTAGDVGDCTVCRATMRDGHVGDTQAQMCTACVSAVEASNFTTSTDKAMDA